MSSRAIEAARAFVRIYADDAALRKSLANLKPTLQATADQFNGIGGNMALAGLTAAGGGLIMTAANAERTAIAFEVMLGSAGRAKEMLDQIYALGTESPFGAEDFMAAGQVLLNFGADASTVVPQLRVLGDIAAGDSEKLKSLTLAFAQMSAAGRLMGQDLLQFVNAGFNPLQEIAKKTGESMAELKKRMEQGGISASEVTDAFKSATEAGGRFHGMTARLAGSTIGVWMALKDEIVLLAQDMGRYLLPLVNMVLSGVRQIVSWFAGWGKAIVVTATAAAGFLVVMKAITLATIAFAKAQAMATALTGPKGWAVLALSVAAGAAAYAAIDLSMKDVAASASATHPPVDTLSKDLKNLQSPGLAAAAALDTVAEASRRAHDAVDGMKTPVQTVRDEVQKFADDLAKSGDFGMILAGNPLVEQFREQKSGFSAMLDDINKEIERLSGNATEASQKLRDMAAAGVDPGKIKQLEDAMKKRDQLLEAEDNKKYWADRNADMQAAADDVRTSIQSVQDAFAQEQQRLQTLVDAGMLSRTDADKFLAKNPKFAQLMQGADSEAISGNMRGNVAKDLRSAEGAGQLYSLINGTVSNEAKQIALLTEMRDEARKARIEQSKRGKAVKI